MHEVRQACEIARRLGVALEDAITNARQLGGPMARLESQSLFVAAARRNEANAIVSALVGELGAAVRTIATTLGWTELTLARLKEQVPLDGGDLEELLAVVRQRATELHRLDETNRVRGNRALSWMRILIAGHTGQTTAYDRRGALTGKNPALSTSSRTL